MITGFSIIAVAEIIKDPSQVVEDCLDALEHGKSKPTRWMQNLRSGGTHRVTNHPVSGATLYDGRACCADQLKRFEGRGDQAMPFEVTCPDCGRVYRVRLDLVRRRT